MSIFCPHCGREYDVTLFQYGRTIECACGRRVGREVKVRSLYRPQRPEELRFMVDVMLGRLARWLRVLGYDAAYQEGIEDADLVRLSLDEGRILLTRDRALPTEWWIDNYLLIDSTRPVEQLSQVVRRYGLPWRDRLFTRCTVCNEPLDTLDRHQALGRVPEKILEHASRFASCPVCNRVYWQGSHVDRMRRRLDEALKGREGQEGEREEEPEE